MAELILPIIHGGGGIDTDEATALPEHVLYPYTAGTHGSDELMQGTMQSMGGRTIAPSSSAQTVSCTGKYMTGNITVGAIPSKYIDMSVGQTSFNYGSFSGLLAGGMTLHAGSWQSTQGNVAGQGWRLPFQYINGIWTAYRISSRQSINLSYIRTITISCQAYFNNVSSFVGEFEVSIRAKNSTSGRILKMEKINPAGAAFTWTMDVSGYTGHQHLYFSTCCYKAAYDRDGNYALLKTINFGV